MSKIAKILILLTFLALCLVLYLIFSAQIVTIKPNQISTEKQINNTQDREDLDRLTNEYKKNIKEILAQWEEARSKLSAIRSKKTASSSDFSIISTTTAGSAATSTSTSTDENVDQKILDKLAALKIKLMSARVPERFKEFHLKLVMSLSDLKGALLAKDEQSEKRSLDTIKEIIEEYKKIVK